MTTYRTCAVPMCKSTSIKYPDKLFIHVPKCPKRRKQWIQLARRNPMLTSDKSTIFFCEDHFNLPDDMENYTEYSIMGSVGKIRMKPDCLPSKFECQPDRIKRTRPLQFSSAVNKRQRMDVIQEILSSQTEIPATSGITSNCNFQLSTEKDNLVVHDKVTQVCPELTNKLVQVISRSKVRSKATQTISQIKDKNTSPLKINITSTATSPFKIRKPGVYSARFGNTKIKRKLLFPSEELEVLSLNSISSFTHSESKTETSPSVPSSLTMTSISSNQEMSELDEIKRKIEAEDLCRKTLESTLRLIKNNPRYYIGISKDLYYLIDFIQKHTRLPEEHILLCLKKIRLNTTFSELADQFGMSLSYASKIFMQSIPVIVNVLRPFVIKSNKRAVKQNLPMAFRHKYFNIYCIIDCLEIEIQKPSKSVEQALSWSEYKKANTAKFLISSTPDGIINYISPGYGGRITDVQLVQDCSFIDGLEQGVSILADRGFKHIEELLLQKGINLVRPPSVPSNSKLSKQDVLKTKQIASLRIHIERVIRRLREFSMLKPHSVVNRKLLKYLDECVVIACALINIQDSIIKNT
ncbi:uncharacterized protein LOC126911390 [Spodoptera frugiperda]|uniref:Uncharacterized protein LOC126911390 n=1 Tax=Spodoptera frugiperda TaxID=7108 RepID=A0A9R0EYP7_SPOFR|nr:uncharacterized protein LOC126911390 [Spodoptera frugiperda]